MKKGVLALFLITSIGAVLSAGCLVAGHSAGNCKEIGGIPRRFYIDDEVIDVGDYTEIEELFLDDLSRTYPSGFLLYDASDITLEIIENPRYRVLERCIGIVTDSTNGDGIILNDYDGDFGYISYRRLDEELRNGTIILSYFMYEGGECDGITNRYDFVINRNMEEI